MEEKHADCVVPDFCEPIVAWRTWSVHQNPPGFDWVDMPLRLMSAHQTIWQPYQQLEARHHFSVAARMYVPDEKLDTNELQICHSAPCDAWNPGTHYGCGIYGVKTAELLCQHLRDIWPTETTVIGQVYLWGHIVEHEHGYRAQYAYPKCIVYTGKPENGLLLAEQYGIPYEEDQKWKSEIQSDESSLNRYNRLFPSNNLAFLQNPWKTQYVQNPLLSQSLSQSKLLVEGQWLGEAEDEANDAIPKNKKGRVISKTG